MTPEEFQAARALADAATPGEWGALYVQGDAQRRTHPNGGLNVNSPAAWSVGPEARTMMQAKRDAEFIAAARTLVPRLLDALEQAQAEAEMFKDVRYPHNVAAALTERAERAEAAVLEARKLLAEALDLAAESIPYAGPYFDEKWNLTGELAALRARAGAQGATP
jgi:GAF domain-containing protein